MDLSPACHYSRSPALIERWKERRSEAVAMLAMAVRDGEIEGEQLDRLAGVIHQIAGTAALFGETPLGLFAAELERALRLDVPAGERLHLARKMLAAAQLNRSLMQRGRSLTAPPSRVFLGQDSEAVAKPNLDPPQRRAGLNFFSVVEREAADDVATLGVDRS